MYFFFFLIIVQSLLGKGVQPGVETQVFNMMKRRVRGRGPGIRVDPADVARTGSTALMPGKRIKGIKKSEF